MKRLALGIVGSMLSARAVAHSGHAELSHGFWHALGSAPHLPYGLALMLAGVAGVLALRSARNNSRPTTAERRTKPG